MAENPLRKLARLLGGVVLMQGRLGHQVLGQLLVMGTNEVAIAGAAVVVAASSRERNAVAQAALRTAAPALAVRALLQKQETRVERRLTLLADRERKIEERERKSEERAQAAQKQKRELETRRSALDASARTTDTRLQEAAGTITALEGERRDLQSELERLTTVLRSLRATVPEPHTAEAVPGAGSRIRVKPPRAANKAVASQQRKAKKRSKPRSKS